MTHVRGRRPPHAADHSSAVKRQLGSRLLRAELVAGLVERVAALGVSDPDAIRRVAREHLAVLADADVDPGAVAADARMLRDAAQRWRALEPGEELSYDWPRPPSWERPALAERRRFKPAAGAARRPRPAWARGTRRTR